jgi:hypothetical protein
MTRCLIINCSKTKRNGEKKLPAIELYDGPAFRVIRSYLRNTPEKSRDLDIFVLSAKYGLISGETGIEDYDELMTIEKSIQLNSRVLEKFSSIISMEYTEILILMSKTYLSAFKGYEQHIKPKVKLSLVVASEGRRLRILKAWLYQEDFEPQINSKPIKVTGRAVLKSRVIEISQDEIVIIATKALEDQKVLPYKIREWYVVIRDEHISPKWLVSILSGIKSSEFQASDARRVLEQLGINVIHV